MGHERRRGVAQSDRVTGRRVKLLLGLAALLGLVLIAINAFAGGDRGDSGLIQGRRFHGLRSARVAVDMHAHTTESDGDFTAEEVISFAQARGLKDLWITDHDMIRSLTRTKRLLQLAAQEGVHLGFGVEITVGWDKKEHHLLGYFPNSVWPHLIDLFRQTACAKVKESRENRNQGLVQWLNSILGDMAAGTVYFEDAARQAEFKPITVKEVGDWAQVHADLTEVTSLGRPHFRKYLSTVCGVRDDLIFGPRSGEGRAVVTADGQILWDDAAAGQTGTQVEALLHSGTLGRRSIKFEPLPIVEAIHLITIAGGHAVLAHLPTLGKKWQSHFLPQLAKLQEAGLWGVETFSAEISAENHAIVAEEAIRVGLVPTGGSDSHGTLKPYAMLGDVWRSQVGVTSAGEGTAQDASLPPYEEVDAWRRAGVATSGKLRLGRTEPQT